MASPQTQAELHELHAETHNARQVELRADTLRVDPRYQRTIRELTVQSIMRNFDPDLIGALYVSVRADGTCVVLDGQQRLEALLRMNYGDQLVPCLTFEGLSVAEEARLFLGFNGPRTKPRPYDMFKAALVAGDKSAKAIQTMIDRHGLTLGDGSGPGRVQSVQAVQRIFALAGPEVLDRSLTVAVRAWGGANKRDALKGEILSAIAVLLARHNPDDGRLVRVLMNEEPHELWKRGKTIFVEFGAVGGSRAPVPGLIAGVIAGLYNKGLPARDKIAWDSQLTGKLYWRSVDLPLGSRRQQKERVRRANSAGQATSDAVLAKAYTLRAEGAKWGAVHRFIEEQSPDFGALQTSTETARMLVIEYARRTEKDLVVIAGHKTAAAPKPRTRRRPAVTQSVK